MASEHRLWDEREEPLIRYLLGDVAADAESVIEERLFVEPDFHEELLATEDDLIRAYLVGALSAADRARFEDHFLASPRRAERLAFIRDVQTVVRKASSAAPMRPAARAPRWQPWLAAAALLLLAIGLYSGRTPTPEDGDTAQQLPTPAPTQAPHGGDQADATATPTEAARPTREPDRRPTPQTPAPPPRRTETRVVRLADSAEAPVDVSLGANVETVRIEVPIGDSRHPTFDAEIRSADGSSVWNARALIPNAPGDPLVLNVPARVLVADAYELRVTGERLRDAPAEPASARTYTLRLKRPAKR